MKERKDTGLRDCEFCQIIERVVPAEIVFETDSCLAFFPLSPATKGHTLVVPKRHIQDFTSSDTETFSTLTSTALDIGKALQAAYSSDGMNLITSAGKAASQTIMHLHVHLVPRWTHDQMGQIWPPQAAVNVETLSLWAQEFRRYLATR